MIKKIVEVWLTPKKSRLNETVCDERVEVFHLYSLYFVLRYYNTKKRNGKRHTSFTLAFFSIPHTKKCR